MKRHLTNIWTEQDGALSFEWALLVTLVVIGIVAGVAATRDAIVDELGDASQAVLSLDGSYTIAYPLLLTIDGVGTGAASDSGFVDGALFVDCGRNPASFGQFPSTDGT